MGTSNGYFYFWKSEGAKVMPGSNGAQKNVVFGTTDDFSAVQESLAHPGEYVLRCKLSSNKKFLATCSSDRTCKIWKHNEKTEEFDPYRNLSGHGGWVWDCDFTVDCVYCLTVSTDMRIRIWKIDEAKVKKAITGHTKGITSLAFKDSM